MDELEELIKKIRIDELLKLAFNWGNTISKNSKLSLATQFIFDKLFSEFIEHLKSETTFLLTNCFFFYFKIEHASGTHI